MSSIGAIAAIDLARVRVEAKVGNRERRGASRGPPPQQGAHPRQELLALERLDQVVVGSRVEPLDPIVRLGAGGEDQDRRVALGAQAAADLDPVELRQPEVEDDEVGHEVLGQLERLHAIAGGAHLVALLAQGAPQDVGDLGVVLDDQHPAGDGLARKHQERLDLPAANTADI